MVSLELGLITGIIVSTIIVIGINMKGIKSFIKLFKGDSDELI